MTDPIYAYSCLLLLGTFLSAVSQVILKKAALKTYASRIREYFNFPVMFAYSLFLVTTFMCIFAYRVVPLSFGPVLEATSYVYITLFGVLIFRERLNWRMILALVLIICGIGVYSLGVVN